MDFNTLMWVFFPGCFLSLCPCLCVSKFILARWIMTKRIHFSIEPCRLNGSVRQTETSAKLRKEHLVSKLLSHTNVMTPTQIPEESMSNRGHGTVF